jgi:hypothetical protein
MATGTARRKVRNGTMSRRYSSYSRHFDPSTPDKTFEETKFGANSD